MTEQMSLALSLRDDCRFDNFLAVSKSGEHIVSFLKEQFNAEEESLVYLWGADGCGRSHLLQAVCHGWVAEGRSVQYLPLSELRDHSSEQVVAGLEYIDLVCIDEINLIAELADWQQDLFHFFNRSRDRGRCLLISADQPPSKLSMGLADLQSRLSTATTFQMPGYTDAEKITVLQFRARRLGLQLSDEAAQFLLNRAPRRLEDLIDKLRELDRSSLIHQRKLSVPFIKQVFSW